MTNLPGFNQPEISKEEFNILFEAISTQASEYLTLCEQIRFIYDSVYKIEDDQLRSDIDIKLVTAFSMAKKMNHRLAYYKKTYNKDFSGSKGSNLLKLDHTKEREAIRKERPAK